MAREYQEGGSFDPRRPTQFETEVNFKSIPTLVSATGAAVVGTTTVQTLTGKTLSSPVLTAPAIGAATADSVAATGAITSSSPSAGIGYAAGAGAAVTQLTDRTTGVTINAISGAITTHNASLAAETQATFTVTNSSVAVGDVVLVCQRSGANGGMTQVEVTTVAAGSFAIKVLNNNPAAGTAETGAIILNFCVIKAVSA